MAVLVLAIVIIWPNQKQIQGYRSILAVILFFDLSLQQIRTNVTYKLTKAGLWLLFIQNLTIVTVRAYFLCELGHKLFLHDMIHDLANTVPFQVSG